MIYAYTDLPTNKISVDTHSFDASINGKPVYIQCDKTIFTPVQPLSVASLKIKSTHNLSSFFESVDTSIKKTLATFIPNFSPALFTPTLKLETDTYSVIVTVPSSLGVYDEHGCKVSYKTLDNVPVYTVLELKGLQFIQHTFHTIYELKQVLVISNCPTITPFMENATTYESVNVLPTDEGTIKLMSKKDIIRKKYAEIKDRYAFVKSLETSTFVELKTFEQEFSVFI